MAPLDAAGEGAAARRWGEDSALLDDEEARRRLVAATIRCIARRGSAQVRMAEVADEAGVARSTVYRYFPTRDDLILGVLLSRIDAALADVVRALPDPGDAARSLPELVLEPLGLVDGSEVNEALFSADSRAFVGWLELGSEQILDVGFHHYGPLLERWQGDGQLHADLDLRETLRWLNAVSLVLLAPPWRGLGTPAKREFLDQFVVRALVPGFGPRP